jgi:hypothetical protein
MKIFTTIGVAMSLIFVTSKVGAKLPAYFTTLYRGPAVMYSSNEPCLIDSADYHSLADAVAITNCDRNTILVSTPQTVTANLTIPDKTALQFTRNGRITVANGKTLTVLGPLRAPPSSIFVNATSGTGAVSFAGDKSLESVRPEWWQEGDDGVKLNAAIAALPSSGGKVDATSWQGQRTISTPVIINKPTKLLFGAATFICPLNSSCFKTWANGIAYSNISIEGLGRGLTVFQVPSAASPQVAANHFNNVFELHDPVNVMNGQFSDHIRIAHMTIDGNKAVVKIPAGAAADDVTHNAVFSAGTRYSTFDDLELKNFYYCGLSFGLYSQFNSFSNIYTANNGYAKPIGYGGIFIGGTSFSNTVTNHISNGDVTGIQIYDNAWDNTLSGGSYTNDFHGIVLSDQRGNMSFANKISATVYNSTSQALSLGGLGIQRNFSIDVVVDGTAGDAGVFVGPNVKYSNFNLVVSRAAGAGVDLRGSYNTLVIIAAENSRVAPASEYALNMKGANYNLIQLAAFDSASNQRALRLDNHSDNNRIALVKSGAVATVSNDGHGNRIDADQDK